MRRARGCGRLNHAHRRGLRRPAGHPHVASHLESQLRPVGIADVDDLTVVDVDHWHPAPVDVRPVQRPIVDSQPVALFEAQQQMRARNQRMRDAHVGPEVTSDDHVMARCKSTLGSSYRTVSTGGAAWLIAPTVAVWLTGSTVSVAAQLAPSDTGGSWWLAPQRAAWRPASSPSRSGAPVTTQRVRL